MASPSRPPRSTRRNADAAHRAAPPEPGDGRLVTLARDGDTSAFGRLVSRHERAVRAVAYSLVGDWAEAEDLAQETFVRAHANLGMLADPDKFARWIRRIAFGVSIDWVRGFRPQLFRTSGDASLDAALAQRTDERGALEVLEGRELAERVRAALAALPDRYRVPLTLYHLDGLSHAKVAAALGVPDGTVRSLVTRARRKLAAALAGDDVGSTTAGAADVFRTQRRPPDLLHVLNGDATADSLRRSDVPGTFAVWADVLHEGPVASDVDAPEWRQRRARFIGSQGWVSADEALATYERWDRGLEAWREHDEVVLWFEHDLFDQLLLARHLEWASRRDFGRTRLSLICIGAFPGVEPFHGLGQLSPDQLASLLDTRQRVSAAQRELGRRAWRALTSDDPTRLERLSRADTSALPFLAGALRRLLEEYPDIDSGLPRTERQILTLLAPGPRDAIELFRDAQRLEERVFMGDWTFWSRVRALAAQPAPLVRIDGAETGPAPRGGISITPLGREVLAGERDWVALGGLDRWIGGVHLAGERVRWRWDPAEERLRSGA